MMQKSCSHLWRVFAIFMVVNLFFGVLPGSAFEEDQEPAKPEIVYIVVREDPSISIEYAGTIQSLHNEQGQSVTPITFMGTTYLPVRAISNILGNDVEWIGETRTIRLTPQN